MKAGTFWKIFIASSLLVMFNNCQPAGKQGGGDNNSGDPPLDQLSDSSKLELSRNFFNDTMVPQFESRCTTCHEAPRIATQFGLGRGAVFDFDRIREHLMAGTSAVDNRMIQILTDPNVHDADGRITSNFCFQGSAEGLCADVIRWWNLAFYGDENATSPFLDGGSSGGGGGSLSIGRLGSVSILGRVFGYARNPDNASDTVDVFVYVGGPVGQGDLVATVTANERGPGGSQAGHYFSYDLPSQYLDGVARDVYVYAMSASSENLLPSPATARAWEISAEAETYFNNNMRSFLSRCVECHGTPAQEYSNRFYVLASPKPGEGGSPTNNTFYQKLTGQGGHGGGTFCSGSNGICGDVQELWRIQFE